MPLEVGSRLGHYNVTALIGEGGMGQVYQATDTKLNRQVALKILPEAFATDPDRLARFQREAQVLASLNHPGIAAIYGLEETDDTRALVLELVEGPTLADRIAQGPIPLDEALPIAKQIAEALEAAHEQGIIHRDLKPANVKVKADGTVKVLDFGLAKALDTAPEGDPSLSPTLTAAATQMGVIMGTAAYMSPEQAAGQVVDKRSDIWSFGVVLFEVLTGQRMITGETVSHVLASVLKTDPDWALLPANTPGPIRRLLRRCLVKKRTERIPDIGMARIEIDEALSGHLDDAPPTPNVDPVGGIPRRPLTLGVVSGAAVAGAVVWFVVGGAPSSPREVTHFTVPVEAGYEMLWAESPGLALSPDGRTLVYSTEQMLWVKHFDRPDNAVALAGTEGAESPFFSPDGLSVGFVAGGRIRRVTVDGGPVLDITGPDEDVGGYVGASWADDGMIVYAGQSAREIWQVPARGGTSTQLTDDDGEGLQPYRKWPQVLDGERVLYTRLSTGHWEDADIVVRDLETGIETTVVQRAIYGRYVRSGHILYATGPGTIMAVPYDLRAQTISGDPVSVESNVRIATWGGGASYAVSDSGTAAFVHGSNLLRRRLWWADRSGRRLREIGSPAYVMYANLSPDGRRLAMDIQRHEGTSIWLGDVATGERERFTLDDSYAFSPVWSPDGQQVAYVSYGYGLGQEVSNQKVIMQDVEGGDPTTVYEAEAGESLWLSSWSPDGEWLAITVSLSGSGDIYALNLAEGGDRVPVALAPRDEFFPQFSPDGRWLAYHSNQTGQNEVFVVSFPDLNDRRQLSVGGGEAPRWAPAGDEIFFWTAEKRLMVSEVSTAGRLTWGESRVLFEAVDKGETTGYTVSPDGQEFQISVVNRDVLAEEIHVAVNWLDGLRDLTAPD